MNDVEVMSKLAVADLDAVRALVELVEAIDHHAPLSEHKWLDLAGGIGEGSASFIVRGPDVGEVIGYAHLCRNAEHPPKWGLEIVTHPEHRGGYRGGVEVSLVDAALAFVRRESGGELHLWAFRPTEIHDELARQLGLIGDRDLLHMRVALPLPVGMEAQLPHGMRIRPFRVGEDEQHWLEVNRRAFASHPEQGDWDLATLERREAEPWFDPRGFLLAENDYGLAGFCWTKIHGADHGEIYVIAADPGFHGLGLGRALTLAGLASLADRGMTTGMLYVDATNTAAVALYRSIGFELDHLDRAYVIDLPTQSGYVAEALE